MLKCFFHTQYRNGITKLNVIISDKNCIKLLFRIDRKNQLDVTFVFFISLLIVAQHVSGSHVPIIRS